ncbi:MAG: Glutamine-scyllo-inositol transaminase [Actinomycetia bacterium]|nr:Glutamine-scyllo-inositol transaminase [Actinomycetes bacterium]
MLVSPRNVPFLDLTRLHATIADDLQAAYADVVATSQFAGGAVVSRFEQEFAAAHGAPHAVGCASGTDALALALRAFDIGPGDEVVVPAMTFIATASAVRHAGAVPVMADVDPVTLLLTAETVAAVRSERTRAILPVHLFGHLVPFDLLAAWRESGLVVIEDAAQAHLATWNGEFVGSVGDAACFSFYPGKNLGALGDGGAIVTKNEAVAERVRSLRDHGRDDHYRHSEVGYCSRLDGMQAAFLSVKLRYLPDWTAARRALAARYDDLLPAGTLVPWTDGAVHHLMVARVGDRDAVQTALAAARIATGVHYPVALSNQPALSAWARPAPAAEEAASTVLSLPMDPLMTPAEVEYVCDHLDRSLAHA